MNHLNAETLKHLLTTRAPDPQLLAHLSAGCETCEAFLASSPDALLDGATDAALVSLAPPDEDAREGRTYDRIAVALKPSHEWRVLGALAAALLVTLAVAWLFFRPPESETGLKGNAVPTLELEAAVKLPDGNLRRVDEGATVPSQGVLVLRYRTSKAMRAEVVLKRPGSRQVLGTVELEAGMHDLAQGISLEGEQGPLEVTLVPEGAVDSDAPVGLKVNIGP
nr:hypothetical protein Hi04_10k_c3807_00014 [uncultured bacterium]